jgi:amidophosphoribosyltransferase
VYGIDMPSRVELVAHGRDDAEIARAIGADLVIFQTLPDLVASVRQFNPALGAFDCSVFTGEYVTGGVDEAYLAHLERLRADNARGKAQSGTLGAAEGKGGGALADGEQAVREAQEDAVGCSGPLSGADDTIGLYNHVR